MNYEYRWANETGFADMITLEEAEYFGYEKYKQHPFYPTSWLMRREVK